MNDFNYAIIFRTRKERGYTLKQVGEAIGLSESMMNYIETGKRKLPVHKLKPLADFLGLPLQAFVSHPNAPQSKYNYDKVMADFIAYARRQLKKRANVLE